MFSNNKTNSNNNDTKTLVWDYLGLLGKVFFAGAAVVGAVKAVDDCIKAEKDFDKKFNAALK